MRLSYGTNLCENKLKLYKIIIPKKPNVKQQEMEAGKEIGSVSKQDEGTIDFFLIGNIC